MRNRRHCAENGEKVGAAVGNLLTAAQKSVVNVLCPLLLEVKSVRYRLAHWCCPIPILPANESEHR